VYISLLLFTCCLRILTMGGAVPSNPESSLQSVPRRAVFAPADTPACGAETTDKNTDYGRSPPSVITRILTGPLHWTKLSWLFKGAARCVLGACAVRGSNSPCENNNNPYSGARKERWLPESRTLLARIVVPIPAQLLLFLPQRYMSSP